VRVIVEVRETSASVGLVEPDDFSVFAVEMRGRGSLQRLADLLERDEMGRLEGEDALIRVTAIRRLAPGADDAEWQAGLEAMVARAQKRGLSNPAGTALRAPVERV